MRSADLSAWCQLAGIVNSVGTGSAEVITAKFA
jgi:hypothetical protein